MAEIDFGSKKLGFGFMRLPMLPAPDGAKDAPERVDIPQTTRMVDEFMAAGFCYFDTAHVYLGGQSELALRSCLTSRYPRERYILTDKLSGSCFEKEADIRPLFEAQLEACGVDYFDFYLFHAISAQNYPKYVKANAFEAVRRLKAEGRVRHIGMSFHDAPELLERILTDHPEIEVVQIQFNYADYDAPAIQSRACYDVCRRFHKPIIVMEPVKGGGLANLPEEARGVYAALGDASPASYAIRFAASFEGVAMVLSGMSSIEQLTDNLSYMKDFHPLEAPERAAVAQAAAILKKQDTIRCTNCRYCVDGCPRGILIPDLFACMNAKKQFKDWNSAFYYEVSTNGHGKASDCIACRACERTCPQHLPISTLMKEVAQAFDQEA